MKNFTCPQCEGVRVWFMVDVTVKAPMRAHYGNLSKTALRSKEVTLVGVDWGKATLVCPDCGWNLYLGKGKTAFSAETPRENGT